MVKPLDRSAISADFDRLVNMAAGELEGWLKTEDSRRVGFKRAEGESVGHASGRRILGILRKAKAALTDDDYVQMRRALGFIRRHRAREPENMITSRWRKAG